MAGLKDKAIRKTKEIAGEILGDGNLAEEGKRQKREERPEEEDAEPGPLEQLRKLT